MTWEVENMYEYIKNIFIEKVVDRNISAMIGEDISIFHMRGLAGFYGPKIILKKDDDRLSIVLKIFSLLTNEIQFIYNSYDWEFYVRKMEDIPTNSIDTEIAGLKDIEYIVDTYVGIQKGLIRKKDTVSSKIFEIAGFINKELIFNEITLPIRDEYREYRVAIIGNSIFIDDIFNEGYFPAKSHFSEVVDNLTEKYMEDENTEEINIFLLSKEQEFLKLDRLLYNGETTETVKIDKNALIPLISSILRRERVV